jgi:hypothetical protein
MGSGESPPYRYIDDIGGNQLPHFLTQLIQHAERAARRSRQLVQTATHLEPLNAITQYIAGLYALQQWETFQPQSGRVLCSSCGVRCSLSQSMPP